MTAIAPAWIAAAQASEAETGIPASVTLAQFILESGWGAHIPGNNPFGIKALPGQPTQILTTHEVIGGVYRAMPQPFRLFSSLTEAFTAHARLLATGGPYASARACLPNVEAFCKVMGAHYATDPLYASKLLSIIDGHDLTQFDTKGTVNA